MNASVIGKEGNIVKFTFSSAPEMLEEGMQYSYKTNKDKFVLPGFRKGKAPRKIIEAQYGEAVFYDDAVNYVLSKEYENIIKDLGLEVVSRPDINVPKLSKEEGITFEIEVTVKPEVKLGKYKGLEIEKQEMSVSDEEIDAEISRIREQNARNISVSDRPAKMGDIVNISYLGTKDGVPFEGGQADNYDLTLGSHSFIDTFEDQVVGHSIGDKFDVNVKFPDEYHEPSLAGANVVFVVELKDISVKELPEVNDEFAQDVSDFDTLDEYKSSIMDKIKSRKEDIAKKEKSDKLVEKVIENTEMDVPQVMIDSRVEQMMREFDMNLKQQGISLDMYCQYTGATLDTLKESSKVSAEKSVKTRLVLEQIAKDENLDLEEEEFKEKLAKIGENYGITAEKWLELVSEEDKKSIKEDLLVQKALELIEETSVEI
ncbi:MAG: trigger factor [Lachnospiraceae bacterium]|nr:trigger factor [Lachnospiraceae bacterium]